MLVSSSRPLYSIPRTIGYACAYALRYSKRCAFRTRNRGNTLSWASGFESVKLPSTSERPFRFCADLSKPYCVLLRNLTNANSYIDSEMISEIQRFVSFCLMPQIIHRVILSVGSLSSFRNLMLFSKCCFRNRILSGRRSAN